jgi:hypothetical protein
MSELGNVVAPEFQAYGFSHSKAVHVEDSATHAELRDVFNHWHSFESDRLQMRGEIFGTPQISLSQLQSRGRKSARELRSLEQGSAGSDQNAEIAAANSLERLDSLTGHFGVRLALAKALARGIKGDRLSFHERAEVSEPALRAGDIVADDNKEPLPDVFRQSGDNDSIARSMQSSDCQSGARWR